MTEKVYLTPWQRVVRGVESFTVSPLRSSEVSQFYWCSEINVSEISDAYFSGRHASTFIAEVGPAMLNGPVCRECGGPIHVFSRQDAIGHIKGRFSRCRVCRERDRSFDRARWDEEHREAELRRKQLQSMPYREYLQTDEWKGKREQALRRARYCCQLCSAGGQLHVHHRTYIRRGAEPYSDLIVLCRECHEVFHQKRVLADGGRSEASRSTPSLNHTGEAA